MKYRIIPAIVSMFGNAAQTPVWFVVWIIMFFAWAGAHIYLGHFLQWYTSDVDFVMVTLLFSAVPFWVENSLKHSQYISSKIQEQTLKTLERNTELIHESLTLQSARDETNIAIILKIIEALNSRSEELQHVLHEVDLGVEKLDVRSEEIDILGKKLTLLQTMLEARADLSRELIERTEAINVVLQDGRKHNTEVLGQALARLDLIAKKLGV